MSDNKISAQQVKVLRERTQAGMMECKKYLVAAEGDIELAIDNMRKDGQLKAAKKEGRTTAEGTIVIASGNGVAVLLEINCETDFVAISDDFQNFADKVIEVALANRCADIESLKTQALDGSTVEEARAALIAKIGENVTLRRIILMEPKGTVCHYIHSKKIGVLVDITSDNADLGKDIAMHIAATNPIVIDAENVPADTIEKEREIYAAQAAESGKPADIVEKMVVGRINKYLEEVSLTGQPFVKNPDIKIGQLLKDANASVNAFHRVVVGEGIEKAADNFVEEVMAQARGE